MPEAAFFRGRDAAQAGPRLSQEDRVLEPEGSRLSRPDTVGFERGEDLDAEAEVLGEHWVSGAAGGGDGVAVPGVVHVQHREQLQAEVRVLRDGDEREDFGGIEEVPSVLCFQLGEEDQAEAQGSCEEQS